MKHRGKTARILPFTLEMYAEPQTRAELVITDLPGTILVKIDTDTNPNRQGGPAPVPTFHTLSQTPSGQSEPHRGIEEAPPL